MNKIPKKLTATAASMLSLLGVLKFDVSLLSYFVVICMTILGCLSMALQAHADWTTEKGNNHNGEVKKTI